MAKKILLSIHRFLQWVLTKPVTAIANAVSSSPKKEAVFEALTALYKAAIDPNNLKSEFLELKYTNRPAIIFSDQHKGRRNGADDFGIAEKNYLAALEFYNQKDFYFINLGDSEELWENNIFSVLKYNQKTFDAERKFIDRDAYSKIYGNHDVFWRHDPLKNEFLKTMYGKAIPIYGGIVIRIPFNETDHVDVFCTHGHQGDASSDGNWFSSAFVAYIWGPLQAFLCINTNTPAQSEKQKTLHNKMMYAWSAEQKNVILITGHTHQPVFNSLTHLERLYIDLEAARQLDDEILCTKIQDEIPKRQQEYNYVNDGFDKMKPTYFNTGCCCFSDGTISGIEVHEKKIRLVLWKYVNGVPTRSIAEETPIEELMKKITSA